MKRKPIQIAISGYKGENIDKEMVYALCNDGSIWLLDEYWDERELNSEPSWIRVSDIPQDE